MALGMLSDEEIIEQCENQLEKYRSISVWHFMEAILKIQFDKMLVRRIRVKLLENPKYIEDVEIDAKGFNRIRFNRNYKEEKYLSLRNWINTIISIAALLLALIALLRK